jgi:cytochrome c nitrite reductase small subunit
MAARSQLLPFIALGVSIGLAGGVGGYTFIYARGGSYLTDDPAACANCHVMQEYYDAWLKSSHRTAAVCNDCHTPAGLALRYATKANNGFWHSFAFTTGRFPEPLQITARNQEIAQESCEKCHAEILVAMDGPHGHNQPLRCARCHHSVGHLR